MPTHSLHSNTEAPVVDFDLGDPLAGFYMMALMCWPDKTKRAVRLAKMGIYLRGELERPYLDFVKRALDASALGRPPDGTLETLAAEVSLDFSVRAFLADWAKRHSARYRAMLRSRRLVPHVGRTVSRVATSPSSETVPRPGTSPISGAMTRVKMFRTGGGGGLFSLLGNMSLSRQQLFWAWMCEPETRMMLTFNPWSLFDPYHDRLIIEHGGFAAAARGPAIDAIDAEFKDSLLGYPMLSGLALILIQIFKDHYPAREPFYEPEIEPSLTSAHRTIAGVAVIKGKYNEVKRYWPAQCFIAPLWAAFLIESGCLNAESLVDVAALEDAYMSVILSEERLGRLLSRAQPFCELVRKHEGHGHRLTRYPERVLQLPGSVVPLPVSLPKLMGDALKYAQRKEDIRHPRTQKAPASKRRKR